MFQNTKPVSMSAKLPTTMFVQGGGMDPDSARKIIESRPVFNQPQGSVQGFASSISAGTVAAPASIAELARGLKSTLNAVSDAGEITDRIYEYCANQIDFLPTYGLQKGALGALIDQQGNSFDTADLMVQLLRAAGLSADYVFGTLSMSIADLQSWLGTYATDIFAARNLMDNSCIPAVVNGSNLEFSHVWVRVTIGGNLYHFDPTIKAYTTKTGINLGTAMSYNATTFLNNAKSGATINADYVQNLNRTNIRNDLSTMTSNLVNSIQGLNKLLYVTIGGTVTAGDTVTITAFNSGLPGGKKAVSYTVSAGNTTTTIATALKNAINADTDFIANSITATSTGAVITITPGSANATTIRVDQNASATETVTVTNPQAGLDDIVGGKTIVPATLGIRQTSHPKLKAGTTPTVWTGVPDTYKHKLKVAYDTIFFDDGVGHNPAFFSSDIYGKRLTLTFNASHQAELRLDGVLKGTSTAQSPGSWQYIQLEVLHPYGTTARNQAVSMRIYEGQFYLIASAWGNAGPRMSELHNKKMYNFIGSGSSLTSEDVLGEQYSTMFYSLNAETCRAQELINRMTNCVTPYHHMIGLCGELGGAPFVDMSMVIASSSKPLQQPHH